jgi:aminomethyltransferase
MTEQIRKTALADVHVAAGGRMVEFAGWLMPVWFDGIHKEHQAVRTAVGMFDVSHMGQVLVTGPDAEDVVDFLVTNDVKGLAAGRALYTPTCNASGTIVDDLIVYKKSAQELLLCVNASTTEKDVLHFVQNNPGKASIVNVSDQYSQIAVQGPKSYELLGRVWPEAAARLRPFDFLDVSHGGRPCMLAGTGYTGEKGYELYVPWEAGPYYWKLFMDTGKDLGCVPVGLGARDTLRLEAKFCLYGNDIDETTNPLEAGLGWTVHFGRPFLGSEVLERLNATDQPRKLVGFEMLERGIPHQHAPIFRDGKQVGVVTSGTKSPTLEKAIGLGYVSAPWHKRGSELAIEIRGKQAKAVVVKTPFYKAAS